jgi:[histone H3]-lysine36 N-dimethyltransferase SETMAR
LKESEEFLNFRKMDKEQLRFYIRTRTILEVNPKTIHEELTLAYGPEVVSYSTVQKWSQLFREGRIEVEDDPRSGRPVSVPTEENINLVREVIDQDPHATYDDIVEETSLSRWAVGTIIHDHLKLEKVSSRWVPHELTPQQKQDRVNFCKENLAKFRSNSWRLCNIVTGDETWIYLRQIGRKQSNASWIGQGENPRTVVRRSIYEPKVLFSLFFKSTGPLLVHAVDKGVTIDRFYYRDNILTALVREIKKQRPKTGTRGIKLLHDNAKPHDNQEVRYYLSEAKIGLIPHPPYSPDLSPCDYWLNDYIKRHLEDYTDEKSLIKAVSNIMKNIPIKEYKKTFDKLLERMQLCIDNNGEYFDHIKP